MNNHFQSRDTTSTVIGFWSDTIGLNGSSAWVVFQVIVARKAMIITGITTISIKPIAVKISVLCSSPIAPLGSINAVLQPLNINAEANKDNIPILLLYFLSLI